MPAQDVVPRLVADRPDQIGRAHDVGEHGTSGPLAGPQRPRLLRGAARRIGPSSRRAPKLANDSFATCSSRIADASSPDRAVGERERPARLRGLERRVRLGPRAQSLAELDDRGAVRRPRRSAWRRWSGATSRAAPGTPGSTRSLPARRPPREPRSRRVRRGRSRPSRPAAVHDRSGQWHRPGRSRSPLEPPRYGLARGARARGRGAARSRADAPPGTPPRRRPSRRGAVGPPRPRSTRHRLAAAFRTPSVRSAPGAPRPRPRRTCPRRRMISARCTRHTPGNPVID